MVPFHYATFIETLNAVGFETRVRNFHELAHESVEFDFYTYALNLPASFEFQPIGPRNVSSPSEALTMFLRNRFLGMDVKPPKWKLRQISNIIEEKPLLLPREASALMHRIEDENSRILSEYGIDLRGVKYTNSRRGVDMLRLYSNTTVQIAKSILDEEQDVTAIKAYIDKLTFG